MKSVFAGQHPHQWRMQMKTAKAYAGSQSSAGSVLKECEELGAPLSDDLLEGAAEIAAFMFGDKSKTGKVYHLARTSRLPFFRSGTRLCARKSTLLRSIEDQERYNSRRT